MKAARTFCKTSPFPITYAFSASHGPFLFGATEKIATIQEGIAELPPIVVLRLRNTTAICPNLVEALACGKVFYEQGEGLRKQFATAAR